MDTSLIYHKRFTPEDFEAQYNLRLRRPDFEKVVSADWISRSVLARETLKCQLDIRYSEGPNQKLDVFKGNSADSPVLIYIHGGYWKSGDKSIYSFIAKPYVEAGVNVVVIGYDLCPDITVTRISEEVREAVAYIWKNAAKLGLNPNKINVMGHSAGGHLTQMMMGTDWSSIDSELPIDLIKSGIPIAPLSYLEPVRLTESLNADIRLSEEEAESQSPMTNHPPVTNATQLVIVGGAETDEFHRQAHMYVDKYATRERNMAVYVVPDVDHFDELNVLTDSNSEFFAKTLSLF